MAAVRRLKLDAHGSSKASKVENESFSWRWVRLGATHFLAFPSRVYGLRLTENPIGPLGTFECQYCAVES